MEVISQLYEPHSPPPRHPGPASGGKSIAGINHCSTRCYQQIQNTPSSISPRIFLRRTDLWIIKTCERERLSRHSNQRILLGVIYPLEARTERNWWAGEGVRLARRWHGLMVGGWLQGDYPVLQGRPSMRRHKLLSTLMSTMSTDSDQRPANTHTIHALSLSLQTRGHPCTHDLALPPPYVPSASEFCR